MSEIKTDGIVLRYANYGEYDRMVTLFSPEIGKISFAARSCRKPGAKLIACLEQFCYGEYVITGKNNRYVVTQCQLKDNFYHLRTDLDAFAYATYFLNLCEEFIVSGEENLELFSLLVRILACFNYAGNAPNTVNACGMVKLLELSGYFPSLDFCVECGEEVGQTAYFDKTAGGVICVSCAGKQNITGPCLMAMRRIREMAMNDLHKVRMEQDLADEINRILMDYVEYHIDRKFRSEKFIMNLIKNNKGKNI